MSIPQPRLPDWVMARYPLNGRPPKPYWMTPLDWALFASMPLSVVVSLLVSPWLGMGLLLVFGGWGLFRAFRALLRWQQVVEEWQHSRPSDDEIPDRERFW